MSPLSVASSGLHPVVTAHPMSGSVDGVGDAARRTDAALACGVAVGLSILVTADQASEGSVDSLAYLWAVGLGLLMLMRRSAPLLVLTLTVVGYFTYYAAGFPAIGVAVPIAAALYSAAELGHVRAAIGAALVVISISTGFRLITGQSAAFVVGYELIGHAALVAAVIALGSTVRARRELLRRSEQVARLSAHQTLLQADQRSKQERIELARELHDSIGHSLSVAALYADVAREAEAEESRTHALGMVRAAVSDSMTQLRSTVAVLRSTVPLSTEEPALAEVGRLLDAPAAAGYDVDLHLDDAATGLDLPASVRATAYRVVQEAVTNVLRHSNGSRITVRVELSEAQLVVRVSDDGTRGRTPRFTRGHGLAGMRERLHSVGGRLEVTAADRGWHVVATVPLGGQE